jgi:CRISPR-associated protein Cas2
MKICREYLDHIQNSVFEGEVTSSGFKELKSRIYNTIDEKNDSVIIYELWKKSFKRSIVGIEKRETSNFI